MCRLWLVFDTSSRFKYPVLFGVLLQIHGLFLTGAYDISSYDSCFSWIDFKSLSWLNCGKNNILFIINLNKQKDTQKQITTYPLRFGQLMIINTLSLVTHSSRVMKRRHSSLNVNILSSIKIKPFLNILFVKVSYPWNWSSCVKQ